MEQAQARKYFISVRGEQAGPFTCDELRARHVRRHTLVWDEEEWAWAPAGSMDALVALTGRAKRATGQQPPSLWNWLGYLRNKAARALDLGSANG